MDKILADGRGAMRESVTDAHFRRALIEAVPELAADIPEEGVHIQVAALGDAVLAHLRSGNLDVALRIAEVLQNLLGGSQSAGEIANALQISFPTVSELSAERGGHQFLARIDPALRATLAGV